jgi:hypothetical protein
MKMMSDAELSAVEKARRAIGRMGYFAAMLGLVAGVALALMRQPALSRRALIATISILLSLPVINVLAILAEEIRKRDWPFVIAATAVLALLAFNVVRRLFG